MTLNTAKGGSHGDRFQQDRRGVLLGYLVQRLQNPHHSPEQEKEQPTDHKRASRIREHCSSVPDHDTKLHQQRPTHVLGGR